MQFPSEVYGFKLIGAEKVHRRKDFQTREEAVDYLMHRLKRLNISVLI